MPLIATDAVRDNYFEEVWRKQCSDSKLLIIYERRREGHVVKTEFFNLWVKIAQLQNAVTSCRMVQNTHLRHEKTFDNT